MKKLYVVVAVAVIVALAATSAMALVIGSKHDMTAAGQGYSGGSLSACQYCHTPHHAVTVAWGDNAPLWNRSLFQNNASDGAGTYTLYGGGGTLSGTTVNEPGTHSKTCLGCHDGLTAVNEVVNGAALSAQVVKAGVLTGGAIDPAAAGYIGTDLTDDHPVGVIYYGGAANAALAGLDNTSSLVAGTTYAVPSGGSWRIYGGDIGVGRVECGSCHDPHSTTNAPFLKGALATICTDCHSNK